MQTTTNQRRELRVVAQAILNAVVMELQRTQGAKIKLTLEVEAEAPERLPRGRWGVVRDNARQLKFKADR